MAKKFPIAPKHPERICWGCDKYCADDDLRCGNGSERIQHPIELDGETWYQNGDWSNLLNETQMRELKLIPITPEPVQEQVKVKPHIKLTRKN